MLEISIKKIERKYQHDYAHEILAKNLLKFGVDYKNAVILTGGHGKPYLRDYLDIRYNLSHADGITACYIGRFEAGVDVEPVRRFPENVVKRSFSASEKIIMDDAADKDLMFFRLWTLKESYVKAIGIGVSYPLKTVEFSFEDGKIISNADNCFFTQYVIHHKYVVSLCRLCGGVVLN